uniref:CENP-V/GFA domain-containing protein n=1 Tax=Peronospora matthiolae TaxID=2874970 RepID=A0AAV1UUS6_9STRA
MTNGGMVREVDRAIGALSTLMLGVGLLLLREVYRSVRTNHDKWERCDLDGGHKDVFYQKKYGMPKLPLFQHRGGCDCGSLRFMVLAPKRVEAFDDSNTFSCKKGRFPFLVIPTSCFEMMESPDVSLYESQTTLCQHVFCATCGVHIFQFDSAQPDCVAVNVYCVEDENFEDMKVVFIPKGSRPLLGRANRQPVPSVQPYRHPLQVQGFNTVREDSDESTSAFQKQMMMWARIDDHEKYREPLSDDTQSSTSTASRTGRFSAASSEDLPSVTKDQLEFYLKRHLDDSRQEQFRV